MANLDELLNQAELSRGGDSTSLLDSLLNEAEAKRKEKESSISPIVPSFFRGAIEGGLGSLETASNILSGQYLGNQVLPGYQKSSLTSDLLGILENTGILPDVKPQTTAGDIGSRVAYYTGASLPTMGILGPVPTLVESALSGVGEFVGEKLTGSKLGGFLGSVLAPLSVGTGLKKVSRVGEDLGEVFTKEGINKKAANIIKKRIDNTDGALDALSKYAPNEGFNTFKTSAEVTQDPGLARLEQAVIDTTESSPFIADAEKRAALRKDMMEGLSPYGADIEPKTLSEKIVSKLDESLSTLTKEERALWKATPKDATLELLDSPDQIRSILKERYAYPSAPEGEIPAELKRQVSEILTPQTEFTFPQLQNVRSDVLETGRAANRAGKNKLSSFSNEVAGIIEDEINKGVSSLEAEAYKKAREKTASIKNAFTGKKTAPSLRQVYEGAPLEDIDVASEIIRDPKYFRQAKKAADLGGQPVKDELKSLLITNILSENGKAVNQSQWLKRFEKTKSQFKEVFNEQEINQIGNLLADVTSEESLKRLAAKPARGQSATSGRNAFNQLLTKDKEFALKKISQNLANLGGAGLGALFGSSAGGAGSTVGAIAGVGAGQLISRKIEQFFTGVEQNLDKLLVHAARDPEVLKDLLSTKYNPSVYSKIIDKVSKDLVLGSSVPLIANSVRLQNETSKKEPNYFQSMDFKGQDNMTKEKEGFQTEPFTPTSAKGEVDIDKLVKAMIKQESGGNEKAISDKGAEGLMQLMPATGKEMAEKYLPEGTEYDPFDKKQNKFLGTKYIQEQLDRFDGDIELALAAYNAGFGKVLKYGGIPPYKETQNYVKNIMANYNKQLKENV